MPRRPDRRTSSCSTNTPINLFAVSRHVPSNTRAQNVNTIDEVPDSSWFTNRIGTVEMTPERIVRGPETGAPPAPEKWVIIREKTAGTNPGFTAKDANGETWFLSFDSRANPEGASSVVAIANKLFWALGYNQIETFITTFDPARTRDRPEGHDATAVGRPHAVERATTSTRSSNARPGTPTAPIESRPAGCSRARCSVRSAMKGTRPDDPNDIVPHEHRRELRALRVFGAWTNLVDLKAGNTLDTLVDDNGRSILKHYLQDVGSTFGMANNPHEWDMGWEYFSDRAASRRRLLTFGFALSPWQTVPYTEYQSVGLFEGDEFDPTTWRPQTPTKPYLELRADDAFWAARRVVAFSDDLIRAAARAGQLSDPAAEQHLAATLIKRRDKIALAYLPAVNPVVNPRLDANGALTFDNAAVAAGVADPPVEYRVDMVALRQHHRGHASDRGHARADDYAHVRRTICLPPSAASWRSTSPPTALHHPSWQQPVPAFFRRLDAGWKLVGLERLP